MTEHASDNPVRIPPALTIEQYALPEDRRGLARLRTLAPLVYATKLFIKHLGEPMTRSQMLGGAVRISERQFGHLAAISERCARALHIETPEVFVLQEPRLNAFTYGHEKPLVIMTSGLVDAMTEGELAFVLGHEFGHIKSEHVLFVNLAEFLRTGAAVGLQWLTAPATLALFAWQRHAERTADRAGLIACQNLTDAEAALIKLALGSAPLFAQIDKEEYLRQTADLETGQAKLAVAFQNHPYTAKRVASLRQWHASLSYRALWDPDLIPPAALPSPLLSTAERVGNRLAEAAHAGQGALARAREALSGAVPGLGAGPLPTAPPARGDEEPV